LIRLEIDSGNRLVFTGGVVDPMEENRVRLAVYLQRRE
jgi:hypothetical protein